MRAVKDDTVTVARDTDVLKLVSDLCIVRATHCFRLSRFVAVGYA